MGGGSKVVGGREREGPAHINIVLEGEEREEKGNKKHF